MRFIGNVLIAGALFFLFFKLGWLGLTENTMENVLIMSAAGGLAFTAMHSIIITVWAILAIGTCGIGCIFFPVIFLTGIAGLWLMTQLFPADFFVTAEPLAIIAMGLALTFIRIPSPTTTTTTPNDTTTIMRQ